MIKYNKQALNNYKSYYKLTYQDIMRITGLKSKASVYLRLNNKISLTAKEIVLLCNESKKIRNTKSQSIVLITFEPGDFFTTV